MLADADADAVSNAEPECDIDWQSFPDAYADSKRITIRERVAVCIAEPQQHALTLCHVERDAVRERVAVPDALDKPVRDAHALAGTFALCDPLTGVHFL